MAIKSVSLLEYVSGDVTTTDSNDVLVNRKYITSEIYNVPAWVGGTSYTVGSLVHVNGKLYTCKEDNTDSSFNAAKWERTYPILHKYTGYANEASVITHNLGTTDITVQVFKNDGTSEIPVWVPVLVNFSFGDGTGADPTNKIKLSPQESGGDYRVVIVAAK